MGDIETLVVVSLGSPMKADGLGRMVCISEKDSRATIICVGTRGVLLAVVTGLLWHRVGCRREPSAKGTR